MDVKIGVQHAPRELVVDTAESPENVQAALTEALGKDGLFTLTDVKGRVISVPASKISYVELGTTQHGAVGFR